MADYTIQLTLRAFRGRVDAGAGPFRWTAPATHFALTRAETSTVTELETPAEALVVPLAGETTRAILEGVGLAADDAFETLYGRANLDPFVTEACRAVWTCAGEDGLAARLLVDSAEVSLVLALARLGARTPKASHAVGGLSPTQLRRVLERLGHDLSEDVSLSELARVAGLSGAHLCRSFKRSMGVPPHAWLVAERVERAKGLLATTGLGVREVAAAVGYGDPNQLARVFRSAVGTSPSRWRQDRRS